MNQYLQQQFKHVFSVFAIKNYTVVILFELYQPET